MYIYTGYKLSYGCVALLHNLKLGSFSLWLFYPGQKPMAEPQHFFLKIEPVLILLLPSKRRKRVYVMQDLMIRAMLLHSW